LRLKSRGPGAGGVSCDASLATCPSFEALRLTKTEIDVGIGVSQTSSISNARILYNMGKETIQRGNRISRATQGLKGEEDKQGYKFHISILGTGT